jgi:eukaryotic-like serine/threonine-protein kinase
MARGPLEPGAQVDRFEIVRLLGSGGMGAVYEARDPELDRAVALKVIREPDPQLSLRLIREAQALAQLQHPNVVAVHEVGTHDDEVFVTMELVDGASFDRLTPKPATWREVVDLFVQAGRGLAAAHAKELVHRDVKPSNLFVGKDGRVRVGDFGLARRQRDDAPAKIRIDDAVAPMDSAETIDMLAPGPPEPQPATALLSSPLTQEGSQIGTPRYMAPEQAAGRRASAQSDQYSFCLALEEMLPARVPGWLSRAVERGLAKDPEARHPSMQALVDVLDKTPRRLQRRAIVGAAVLGAATVAGAFLLLASRDDGAKVPAACTTGPSRMVGVWDDERRAAAETAFAATGLVYAKDSFARIAATLDERRDRWVTMHKDACEATLVHGTQSPELLDRRMACLDERRAELGAYVHELTTIDPEYVVDAERDARAVARVEACADAKYLEQRQPPPSDPEKRRRYDALIEQAAAADATLRAGHRSEAREQAARIATEAEADGWQGIVGKARYVEGRAHGYALESKPARVALEKAAIAATAAGEHLLAADAWSDLVQATFGAGDADGAKALFAAADAAVLAAGSPPASRLYLVQAKAMIQGFSGDPAGAHPVLLEALAAVEKELPGDDSMLLTALANVATMELQLGMIPEAIAHRRRALEVATRYFGEHHPSTVEAIGYLGQALAFSEDLAAARATLTEALAAAEVVHGPDSPRVAVVLEALGTAEAQLEDYASADVRISRAIAIREKSQTHGLGRAMILLAQVRLNAGNKKGALEAVERALPVIEAIEGKDSFDYAVAEAVEGLAAGCRSRERIEHAVELLTRMLGPEHQLTADAVAARKTCK